MLPSNLGDTTESDGGSVSSDRLSNSISTDATGLSAKAGKILLHDFKDSSRGAWQTMYRPAVGAAALRTKRLAQTSIKLPNASAKQLAVPMGQLSEELSAMLGCSVGVAEGCLVLLVMARPTDIDPAALPGRIFPVLQRATKAGQWRPDQHHIVHTWGEPPVHLPPVTRPHPSLLVDDVGPRSRLSCPLVVQLGAPFALSLSGVRRHGTPRPCVVHVLCGGAVTSLRGTLPPGADALQLRGVAAAGAGCEGAAVGASVWAMWEDSHMLASPVARMLLARDPCVVAELEAAQALMTHQDYRAFGWNLSEAFVPSMPDAAAARQQLAEAMDAGRGTLAAACPHTLQLLRWTAPEPASRATGAAAAVLSSVGLHFRDGAMEAAYRADSRAVMDTRRGAVHLLQPVISTASFLRRLRVMPRPLLLEHVLACACMHAAGSAAIWAVRPPSAGYTETEAQAARRRATFAALVSVVPLDTFFGFAYNWARFGSAVPVVMQFTGIRGLDLGLLCLISGLFKFGLLAEWASVQAVMLVAAVAWQMIAAHCQTPMPMWPLLAHESKTLLVVLLVGGLLPTALVTAADFRGRRRFAAAYKKKF